LTRPARPATPSGSASVQGPGQAAGAPTTAASLPALRYAKDDGLESDNQTVGGIDFESYFREKHSWYARAEAENDQIAALDLRVTAAAGYGYFFLKKANHTLRGRTGLMFRHESLKGESSKGTAGLDLGISHLYRFDNAWRLTNDVTYTPSLEDYRDYRICHESAFEIPIVASEIWKLRLGVSNDYNSRPAENKDYLDTTYFTRLVFSWQ
jgi:putative salt-induced outer membrane protein YdiY